MSPLEGYKGPENDEKLSGKQDVPQSFESGKVKVDGKINDDKDESDELKQKINNGDLQLKIKIEETIDTFEEQSGNKLGEQEKNEINTLLLNGSKESPSSRMYVDKVLNYIKKYGNEVTVEDFKEIIGMVSESEQIAREEEKEARKEENEAREDEQKIKKKEQSLKSENNNKNEKIKTTEELELLETLNNSLSGLSSNNEYYGSIVEKVRSLKKNGYPKEDINQIINQLKTDNAFEHIATDIKKNDEKNGTNNYGEFKKTLLKIDNSSFNGIIERFEAGLIPAKQKIVLGKENIYGVDIGKNVLRIRDNDGSITEAGKDGRKLFLAGSDYKLDSKINNGGALREISSVEEDFKKEMEEINRELDTLIAIMEYVDDAIANNVELSVVKQTIKSENVDLYNKMNLDSLKSLEQVKNSFVVMIKQKEEEKEKKIKEKKGIIDEIIRQNALSAKEIDEKKKEILKFLHQIKFDLLPKDLTDQILNEFKSNVFGIPGVKYFFQKVQIS